MRSPWDVSTDTGITEAVGWCVVCAAAAVILFARAYRAISDIDWTDLD